MPRSTYDNFMHRESIDWRTTLLPSVRAIPYPRWLVINRNESLYMTMSWEAKVEAISRRSKAKSVSRRIQTILKYIIDSNTRISYMCMGQCK